MFYYCRRFYPNNKYCKINFQRTAELLVFQTARYLINQILFRRFNFLFYIYLSQNGNVEPLKLIQNNNL